MSTGEGGMITTDREDFNIRLRQLRQHSMSVNDLNRHRSASIITEEYLELGFNYRMTDLQAAIGIAQLRRLPQMIQRRRKLAENYQKHLSNISALSLFYEPPNAHWNYQTYVVRLKNANASQRDALMQKLLDSGIVTRRGIMSIHREPSYLKKYGIQQFPHSERASDQCICLPLYSQMSEAEQNYVIEQLKKALGRLDLS